MALGFQCMLDDANCFLVEAELASPGSTDHQGQHVDSQAIDEDTPFGVGMLDVDSGVHCDKGEPVLQDLKFHGAGGDIS